MKPNIILLSHFYRPFRCRAGQSTVQSFMLGRAARWAENQSQAQHCIRAVLARPNIFCVRPCFKPVFLDRAWAAQNSPAQTFRSTCVHSIESRLIRTHPFHSTTDRAYLHSLCGWLTSLLLVCNIVVVTSYHLPLSWILYDLPWSPFYISSTEVSVTSTPNDITTGIRGFAECWLLCRVPFVGHSAKKDLPSAALGKVRHSANRALPSAEHSAQNDTRQRQLCRVSNTRQRGLSANGCQRPSQSWRPLLFAECQPLALGKEVLYRVPHSRHSAKHTLPSVISRHSAKYIFIFFILSLKIFVVCSYTM
jgi:hypothetical protein